MKRSYVATFRTSDGMYSIPYHFTNKNAAINFIKSVGLKNTNKGSHSVVQVFDSKLECVYVATISWL